tara:strand:+ start:442 stop:1128 length:687 start_codon:yes stop_codon:yes gene_type:complete
MSESFDPFATPETKEPRNEEWAAKRRVSDATRRLITNLVTSTDSAEELNRIAEQVEVQANALAKGKSLKGITAFEFSETGDYGSRFQIAYELNPLFGKSNPLAPPFNIWFDGDKAYGQVRMDWQYEGPPNSVHGGFVAALFDQFLGVAQKMTKQPGFTGTLNIRYLVPTPIDTDLRLEGWVEKIDGRKNFLVSEMWAGDTLTARCEGIFISASMEALKKLRNRYHQVD